jgi:hypothetical protein
MNTKKKEANRVFRLHFDFKVSAFQSLHENLHLQLLQFAVRTASEREREERERERERETERASNNYKE